LATLAEFRAQFPEFAGRADELVSRVLVTARALHGLRGLATLYCAAHLLELDDGTEQPDGGYGEVVSETVGGLSSRYKPMAEANRQVFFATTTYGRMFLALESRSAYGAPIRVY